jgi:hypothetical protein
MVSVALREDDLIGIKLSRGFKKWPPEIDIVLFRKRSF